MVDDFVVFTRSDARPPPTPVVWSRPTLLWDSTTTDVSSGLKFKQAILRAIESGSQREGLWTSIFVGSFPRRGGNFIRSTDYTGSHGSFGVRPLFNVNGPLMFKGVGSNFVPQVTICVPSGPGVVRFVAQYRGLLIYVTTPCTGTVTILHFVKDVTLGASARTLKSTRTMMVGLQLEVIVQQV